MRDPSRAQGEDCGGSKMLKFDGGIRVYSTQSPQPLSNLHSHWLTRLFDLRGLSPSLLYIVNKPSRLKRHSAPAP